MAKKPKEPDSSNGNSAKSSGDPNSSSSSVFKTLFGDVAEHHASASIFSDDNPFRRKPSDRSQTPHQQGGLRLGSGSAEGVGKTTHADHESADLFEAKKRKRTKEKKASPNSDLVDEISVTPLQRKKKSKKDEPKSSNFGAEWGEEGAAKNGDIGLDSKESEKEGKGRKHNLSTGLIEASEIGKGEDPNLEVEAAKDRDVGMDQAKGAEKKKKKRKRDELEAAYEARHYDVAVTNEEGGEGGMGGKTVGKKRKKVDDQVDMVVPKEGFDDEAKLLRTVFVGNLSLKVKKKSLFKEFSQYGEVESVRIRSVPILDTKKPRKCAIIQKKINDAVDSVHAYIVFKTEEAAQASLGHNMAVVGGNHIRVDRACPPLKKLKGENIPLYDNKRTIFVGNLPFDVKDEEIYQLFSGIKDLESNIEAIRVIRDSGTSLGKGIAFILFKTRGAANLVAKKHSLKLRDRELRVCHARSNITPSKRKNVSSKDGNDLPTKRLAVDSRNPDNSNSKVKTRAANSYQGLRASKSGVQKKVHPRTFELAKLKSRTQSGEKTKERKSKRPAVAARKANALKGSGASKQTGKKRKLESRTPENARPKKKTRKFR